MTLILGIDPGSRITGFGVVRDTGRGCEYIASGCIRTGSGSLPERLQTVYRGVSEVIRQYGPIILLVAVFAPQLGGPNIIGPIMRPIIGAIVALVGSV